VIDSTRIGEVTMKLLDRLGEDYGEEAELIGVTVTVEVQEGDRQVVEWESDSSVAHEIGMAQIVASLGARDD
jgi:hypothetical protein